MNAPGMIVSMAEVFPATIDLCGVGISLPSVWEIDSSTHVAEDDIAVPVPVAEAEPLAAADVELPPDELDADV